MHKYVHYGMKGWNFCASCEWESKAFADHRCSGTYLIHESKFDCSVNRKFRETVKTTFCCSCEVKHVTSHTHLSTNSSARHWSLDKWLQHVGQHLLKVCMVEWAHLDHVLELSVLPDSRVSMKMSLDLSFHVWNCQANLGCQIRLSNSASVRNHLFLLAFPYFAQNIPTLGNERPNHTKTLVENHWRVGSFRFRYHSIYHSS